MNQPGAGRPRRLAATPYEKVWGTSHTEPWYANPKGRNIGEVWFAASNQAPLLVKLLFTSERLSVQTHPNDDYAREHEHSRGKTEMWHVLRAEPGAQVALGLRETVTRDRLREASQTGEIEALLNWIPAHAGDTFFVPAGTIHAIGAGLVMCEVQQLSDITYRLYDYGRARPLHLDRGVEVANLNPYDGHRDMPIECPYFRTSLLTVKGRALCPPQQKGTIYVVLEGEGRMANDAFLQGEGWETPAGGEPFVIESAAAKFLVTSEV